MLVKHRTEKFPTLFLIAVDQRKSIFRLCLCQKAIKETYLFGVPSVLDVFSCFLFSGSSARSLEFFLHFLVNCLDVFGRLLSTFKQCQYAIPLFLTLHTCIPNIPREVQRICNPSQDFMQEGECMHTEPSYGKKE